jgi:uncharacterized cofD-like protein
MRGRITVLGGGHGLGAVLRALRNDGDELTVVVTVADDGGSSGALRRRRDGPAVGDLRRSLVALASDQAALARAFARPVTINRLGEHPLGNLVIRSLSEAFGDLQKASEWLGGQLGVCGRVLPASLEPVCLLAHTGEALIEGESAIGAADTQISLLRFRPEQPRVPAGALEAISKADWILLGPGSLYTSVLATSALPDVAAALVQTPARVIWICNLEPQRGETTGMTASDHLTALLSHGVRVDAVLYDPEATLSFHPDELARHDIEALPRTVRSDVPGLHDPERLRAELGQLFSQRDGGSVNRLGACS